MLALRVLKIITYKLRKTRRFFNKRILLVYQPKFQVKSKFKNEFEFKMG